MDEIRLKTTKLTTFLTPENRAEIDDFIKQYKENPELALSRVNSEIKLYHNKILNIITAKQLGLFNQNQTRTID